MGEICDSCENGVTGVAATPFDWQLVVVDAEPPAALPPAPTDGNSRCVNGFVGDGGEFDGADA